MEQESVKVVVVGAGVMGYGIAQVFARGGVRVSLVDISQEALNRASNLIETSLETMATEGFLEEPVQTIRDRVSLTTSLEEGAKDADVAIEAIFENVDAKKKVFAEMDRYCLRRLYWRVTRPISISLISSEPLAPIKS
jgi:3-hydroxyacyl-CoA dehydrogenase